MYNKFTFTPPPPFPYFFFPPYYADYCPVSSDALYPLPDGVLDSLHKKTIPFPSASRCISIEESFNDFYFGKSQPLPRNINDVNDSRLIDLDTAFIPFRPSGFYKRKLPNHENAGPTIERVSALEPSPMYDNSHSKSLIAKSVNAIRLNNGCSGVGKRRYANYCCEQKMKAVPPLDPANVTCPANSNICNVLTNVKNLYARDVQGHQHIHYLVLSFFVGKDNHLITTTSEKLSKHESSLKITAESIAEKEPKSIEAGIFYPKGSDYRSLALDRAKRITQLAHNHYITKSSVYQLELDRIARNYFGVARAPPTMSQLHAISKYTYLKLKRNTWLDFNMGKIPHLKIYDKRCPWRHGDLISDSRQILPRMQVITGKQIAKPRYVHNNNNNNEYTSVEIDY